jgi:hypothetical protein
MYNNKNMLLRIKSVQELTRQHYEPGRYDRSYTWVYHHHVYPMYPMSYKTYLKYLKVNVEVER